MIDRTHSSARSTRVRAACTAPAASPVARSHTKLAAAAAASASSWAARAARVARPRQQLLEVDPGPGRQDRQLPQLALDRSSQLPQGPGQGALGGGLAPGGVHRRQTRQHHPLPPRALPRDGLEPAGDLGGVGVHASRGGVDHGRRVTQGLHVGEDRHRYEST